jgi:hypothetical protein
VGAGPDDEGDPKLDAMERMTQYIVGGKATIRRIGDDLRIERAYQALAHADIVFGCVDNDGARQILNEIAKAYALPYFDLASGIDAPDGRFEQAGGRVALVTPTGHCLNCWNLIDRAEARYFLGTSAERAELKRRGYVDGWDLTSPSVIFLNSAIASISVGEFIAYVTALTPANPLTFYYYREPGSTAQRASARRDANDPKCFTCAQIGKGDAIELHRYAITDPEADE